MRPHFFLVFISLFTAASLSAQKKQPVSKADKKMELQLRKDIGYLSNDALQGRRTGSEGERLAGDYLVSRYQALHIAPYKGDYRHTYDFTYGKEIGNATMIKIGGDVMHLNDDAFPLPFSASKKVISDVLPDVMEQGNIWLVPLYQNDADAADSNFDWEKSIYDRSKEAISMGATAIVFYDAMDSHYAPYFNTQSQYDALDIPVVFVKYNPWHQHLMNNHGSISVELNISVGKAQRQGTNIAAYIDNKAKYTVVIGAHYDHLGLGEDGNTLYSGKDPVVFNGADDNASGTAAVLVLAERIKKKGLKHYNYLFINFSGEELGLFGSKAFVKNEALDSTHLAYMINMDMVGRLQDSAKALTIGGVGTAPDWAAVVTMARPSFKVIVDSSGIGPSDHTSFYNIGVPVLFYFSGTHRDYHKPSDDSDKINYPGEVRILNHITNVVSMMDKKPKPVYQVTKSNDTDHPRFKVTLGIMPDYSYDAGDGLRVDGVSDAKPAARAGIKAGDIIFQLGNDEVKSIQSYMEALSHLHAGDKTEIRVRRDGKEVTLPIQL